jgi:glucose/arabinose dehydrogenase
MNDRQLRKHGVLTLAVVAGVLMGVLFRGGTPVTAQNTSPTMLDPNLSVRAVVTGLTQPTTIAFIGENDLLVLEKGTGRVQRVVNGAVDSTVVDLAVNSGSERGLLGVALHPDFPSDPGVYLYWTESTTGSDTTVLAETPLLGNRVDRYNWNGSTLSFDRNLIRLRALQPAFTAEPTPVAGRGNHNGGVLAFGSDGKIYIFIGDNGRRGQLQNLPNGPFGPGQPDDQFGGPQPDNAHLTGVILRLNADGTTPSDNPFFAAGASIPGEVGANIQKIFSYGHRNGFGMAIDTSSRGEGNVWLQENGDDSFSELNRVTPGMNGGWVQISGPVERIAQFKATETTPPFVGLQQARWPPTNIADTPEQALSRLFMLPGATYSDPQFSWRFEVAPGGMNFLRGRALGPQFEDDLFMGAGTANLVGGYLFHFNLTGNRRNIGVDDPRLADRVADNLAKHEITESESLLIGRDFGITSDIETGPNGNLFVVSLSRGTIYEVFRRN